MCAYFQCWNLIIQYLISSESSYVSLNSSFGFLQTLCEHQACSECESKRTALSRDVFSKSTMQGTTIICISSCSESSPRLPHIFLSQVVLEVGWLLGEIPSFAGSNVVILSTAILSIILPLSSFFESSFIVGVIDLYCNILTSYLFEKVFVLQPSFQEA